MRVIMVIFIVLIVGIAGVAVFFVVNADGPTPFADGCSTTSDKVTFLENCAGAPNESYVEIGKGDSTHFLLLDMGEGQEGTGDLIIHYKTESEVTMLVEFGSMENNNFKSIESKPVRLVPGTRKILVDYVSSPTPFRYVRIYASEERKIKLDAIQTETQLPDSDKDGMDDEFERTYGLNPLVSTGEDGPNADLDSDTLTNKQEFDNGINPRDSDTDDDWLPDNWEIAHSLKPNNAEGKNGMGGNPDKDNFTNYQEYEHETNPQTKDTDEDGLSDSDEVNLYGTKPNEEDTDGDEMKDGWEVFSNLDPNVKTNQNEDPDADGLINLDESKAGSNANDADTDDDGLTDLVEVQNGKDPNNWDDGDCDHDGINNGEEKNNFKTDPWNPDSDQDGLWDGWEIDHGFEPLNAAGDHGGQGDPDQDGVPNVLEFTKKSEPHLSDTDLDGLPDAWEIAHCLLPYDKEGDQGAGGDPDQDGKTNFIEMGLEEAPVNDCNP